MTDWHSRLAFELPFLERTLQRHLAHSVLDSACGTGWHAIALAQRGYAVAGRDASAEMITRARANAAHAGLTIPFVTAPFESLPAGLPAPFDALLCLGNSFPHVLTEAAARASLTQ